MSRGGAVFVALTGVVVVTVLAVYATGGHLWAIGFAAGFCAGALACAIGVTVDTWRS